MGHKNKKLLTLFFSGILFSLSTINNELSANTFKTAFDRFNDLLNNGNGYANYDNLNGSLAWGESYIMMSYMAMYRATNDIEYLKKLIAHTENIINQRDDYQGRLDYRGISGPTWASTKYSKNNEPYAWVVHSGMITYPMADFSQLIINNPDLQGHYSYSGKMFLDVAHWLNNKIAETIASHDDQWDDTELVYRFRNTSVIHYPNIVLPFNQQAAMGRTLLMMYLSTGRSDYLYKTVNIAIHFHNNLVLNSDNNSYIWNYFNHTNITEDISHAAIEVDFSILCYQHDLLFNKTDMERFASTFKNNIYIEPLKITDKVDGSGETNSHINQTGRWLNISSFDRDIYHVVADIFMDKAIYQSTKELSASSFLAIANLQRLQKAFNPIAVNRTAEANSEFAGAATGDFDGDGIDEIISARNLDGSFHIYKLDSDNEIITIASHTPPDPTSQWAGVAASDFNGNGRDEFIAVSNSDGNFYIYELDDGQIKLVTSNTLPDSTSQWAGVAAGDFDGDGKGEFVAVSNLDDNFYIYELDDGQIKHVASSTSSNSSSQWAGIAASDFDGDGIDEFVSVRNSDGNFYIHELDNGQIKYVASNKSPGPQSQWTGITAGDFDGDGIYEFIANRNFDGDFYIYTLDNGQIKSKNRVFFPKNLEHGILASGKVQTTSQKSDDLILIRNFDEDIFIFSIENSGILKKSKKINKAPTKWWSQLQGKRGLPSIFRKKITHIKKPRPEK